MLRKQIRCRPHENVFQAFTRAVKAGELPADAKLFPLKQGVPEPEAPAGYRTVGTVLIRPRESFAVGVPVAATPSFEVGEMGRGNDCSAGINGSGDGQGGRR